MSTFFFRNDDVRETLDDSLVRLTQIFMDYGVPITHAVEPGNVTEEVTSWLLEVKSKYPRLLEIIQHGFDHTNRLKGSRPGEFGGTRGFQEQYNELKRGMEIMNDRFGDKWFRGFCFPFGPYNPAAMKALDDLGFLLVNSHFNKRISRRTFYALGHLLRSGYLFGKRVSWNLRYRPGSNLFEADMNVSFIRKYNNEETDCDFHSLEALQLNTQQYLCYPTVGVLFHHRYHVKDEHFDLVRRYLDWLKKVPDTEYATMEEILHKFGKK